MRSTVGRIHSIQSMGTLDGPGIRFVVFLQGCPLRCGCCHNPDTWDNKGGTEITAGELVDRALRYREYFGEEGGITLSGGEPLMQCEFARAILTLSKEAGLNTCLDTSGCILTDSAKGVLEVCDRVLLDVKYLTEEKYKAYVGSSLKGTLNFLDYLREKGIKTTVRQVIIPTKNDADEDVIALKNLTRGYPNVDKVELLPFKKICAVKYDNMGIKFPFADVPTPTAERMKELNRLLNE